VKRGSIEQAIDSTGVVAAESGADVKIGSQISGRIKRLYAELDTQVKAGQVIAEIDVPDLQANLTSAQRNVDQTRARYEQQLQGVGMQHTQVTSAFEQASQSIRHAEAARAQSVAALASAKSRLTSARAGLVGAQAREKQSEAKLRSAQAAVSSQLSLTSTDVRKAQAALETAQATLVQTQKSADLQIANSDTALKQAQSNARLAAVSLKRQEALQAKGFVAAQDVDTQRTQSEVNDQQVQSADATLRITREKVAADLTAARNQVEQAKATLTAAQAGSYLETMRNEDVRSAQADIENSKSAIDQAQLAVAAAQADVESAQSQISSADSDLRSSQAAERAALGNMTQDKLKQQDVKAAYEAMRQAEAQVKNQQAQVDRSYIRSPIAGTVVSLSQQEGETVAAQLSAPTLIEVVDLDRLEVAAYVDETDIGRVKVGLPVAVTVDAFPKRKFPGKISKIASVATVKDNVVTYQVTVDLDKYPTGTLKPQMTADVHITLGAKQNILVVPNEAVKQRRGGSQVAVLKEGKGEVRQVKTGVADAEQTEVVSGLQEGENVVLAGWDKLGVQGFGSAAGVPGFLTRGPLGGQGGGAPKGGPR
jgi:RND family efflux transporter MFP subunit